jgi:hypothetical protein
MRKERALRPLFSFSAAPLARHRFGANLPPRRALGTTRSHAMRLLPALCALLLAAAPAAAQSVTHSVDGRFGVTYPGGAGGTGSARGVYDVQYTMTIRHPLDNGWTVGVSIGVGTGNVERRGPRTHPGAQPGLRFGDRGS